MQFVWSVGSSLSYSIARAGGFDWEVVREAGRGVVWERDSGSVYGRSFAPFRRRMRSVACVKNDVDRG
jgi:hypothetical protein